MTEPLSDFDSELVDVSGLDLSLNGLEGSVLDIALARLDREAMQREQATTGFNSSI
ncbi:hypothetical protein [Cryptosporangium japonicum]|uniref:FXSXX-COOH protein n=1 Tax=Cryptosporangium japonicum TaxID=80872 RepID=A0ABN0TTD6_9ACTN